MGAKYEAGKDITKDSLILVVQRYFNEKGKNNESAIANYYAAQFYDVSSNFPKALESYMQTAYDAEKSNNNLLAGKSLNNIGYIYFEKSLFDSAVINYKKALSYYEKIENIDNKKIQTLINIGRTFEGANKLDSAYLYFEKGLLLAKKQENTIEESQLYLNLGATCYGKREYEKAIAYYQSALNMDITGERQMQKINLYLLNIYNEIKDTKLSKQYADLVVASLPNVTNLYTIKETYAALSEYYKLSGDYKQALEYSNLEKATKDQIEIEADVPAIIEANNNFYLTQKEREAGEFREIVLYISMLVFVVLVVITLFAIYAYREHKKDEAEIQMHRDKFSELRKTLASLRSDYPKIEAEIKAMQEDTGKGKEEGEK